jgi:hypothetical protein
MGTCKGEENVKLPTLSNRTLVRRARGALCSRALRLVLAGTVLVCATAPVAPVQAAAKNKDKREIKAREAFAQGHYEEALDLFAKLYAEKLHPTYLRNIGRCYQNLKMPEKAINAFNDYLRQGKEITVAEQKEVEGYISEMEILKKKQEDEAAAKAPPPAPPPAPVPAPAPSDDWAPTVDLSPQPASSVLESETPFYKKGWFWGVVGVVVVAGVLGGLYAGGVLTPAGQCPSGATCKTIGGAQ